MGQIKPQPNILTIWRLLFALGMAVPAFLNAVFFRFGSPPWFWLTAGWLVVFLLVALVYLPLRYHRLSYTVDTERVTLYSGVLYTRVRAIPLRNIQFTALRRNPFERLFGLSSLVVTAAGGRLVLPGLRHNDAEALAAVLSEQQAD